MLKKINTPANQLALLDEIVKSRVGKKDVTNATIKALEAAGFEVSPPRNKWDAGASGEITVMPSGGFTVQIGGNQLGGSNRYKLRYVYSVQLVDDKPLRRWWKNRTQFPSLTVNEFLSLVEAKGESVRFRLTCQQVQEADHARLYKYSSTSGIAYVSKLVLDLQLASGEKEQQVWVAGKADEDFFRAMTYWSGSSAGFETVREFFERMNRVAENNVLLLPVLRSRKLNLLLA
jgi:hypothetical protein